MDQSVFEAYSYRVGARFGSRVKIAIKSGTVSITGPRVGVGVYQLWIAGQVLLLIITIAFLLTALLSWSLKYLILGLISALAYWNVGTFGAVGFWELENLKAFGEGAFGQTTTFSKMDIKRIKLGPGWARNGLWLVILPYMAVLNKVSEGVCVSFEAPDGVTGGNSVYAFHMRSPEEAQKLAKELQEQRITS